MSGRSNNIAHQALKLLYFKRVLNSPLYRNCTMEQTLPLGELISQISITIKPEAGTSPSTSFSFEVYQLFTGLS